MLEDALRDASARVKLVEWLDANRGAPQVVAHAEKLVSVTRALCGLQCPKTAAAAVHAMLCAPKFPWKGRCPRMLHTVSGGGGLL